MSFSSERTRLRCANEAAAGALQPLDARGRWLCQIAVLPANWDTALWSAEACTEWLRNASGVPDLAPQILSVGRWRVHATVAEQLVSGRILFCGDAAHQLLPTGGLGVNSGIAGAHNVMWKVALVAKGLASPVLIGTYDDERRPVARWAAEQSHQNHQNVELIRRATLQTDDGSPPARDAVAAARRYGNHFGVELGVRYNSGAIVPDTSPPPFVGDEYADYAPSANPGRRAPIFGSADLAGFPCSIYSARVSPCLQGLTAGSGNSQSTKPAYKPVCLWRSTLSGAPALRICQANSCRSME